AVGILTRVISAVGPWSVTTDAGLTSIQVDAGTPHAAVSGHPEARVGAPSQEHLPIQFDSGRPGVGDLLVLVPRHVDTAVAQFDKYFAATTDGRLVQARVEARHHTSLST